MENINISKYHLSISPNTRSGLRRKNTKSIVITSSDYFGFSARQNRNVIERIKYNYEEEKSVNYIVDINGEVLEIIPDDEKAICTKNFLVDKESISIMMCLDKNGNYSSKEIENTRKLIEKMKYKYDIVAQNVFMEYNINFTLKPRLFFAEISLFDNIFKF